MFDAGEFEGLERELARWIVAEPFVWKEMSEGRMAAELRALAGAAGAGAAGGRGGPGLLPERPQTRAGQRYAHGQIGRTPRSSELG
ncbi:MAG: hypothetical protein KHZ24_04360 [Coriobacteriia bacterium]|nr:hypothetical protein [Coriobacteriia bacterium]